MAANDSQDRPTFHFSVDDSLENDNQPQYRRGSPSPSCSPTPAIGAVPELDRSVSMGSSVFSDFSGRSSIGMGDRESLGSMTTAGSRLSSGSYTTRQSTGGLEKPKRRGFVRPQGTYFAASAQSRESVMSLGSIAHLQYYFARTGLLDGKGGRLKMKTGPLKELDLSSLNSDSLSPSDPDSSYGSSVGSPEFSATRTSMLGDSSIMEEPDSYNDDYEYYSDEDHQSMLPPTVSTYNPRLKPIPRPPTLAELKADLHSALKEASNVLASAKSQEPADVYASSPIRRHSEPPTSSPLRGHDNSGNQGWYELQGMRILDVVTLAIRAAKLYYTAHDQPARLASIKSERKIRSDLLGVMDVLKRMATRNFAGGMKAEECETMEDWIESIWDMLRREDLLEEEERAERLSWLWLDDSAWPTPTISEPCIERELSFLRSISTETSSLPPYAASKVLPTEDSAAEIEISPFLRSLQDGRILIGLHNACVKRSKRPFGAVPKWHGDTGKPYRMAENLRYWIKAAELRWEAVLKVDVMGVVNGVGPHAWQDFEQAIWTWCRVVRTELSSELRN